MTRDVLTAVALMAVAIAAAFVALSIDWTLPWSVEQLVTGALVAIAIVSFIAHEIIVWGSVLARRRHGSGRER